jgi:hypothetical protein
MNSTVILMLVISILCMPLKIMKLQREKKTGRKNVRERKETTKKRVRRRRRRRKKMTMTIGNTYQSRALLLLIDDFA